MRSVVALVAVAVLLSGCTSQGKQRSSSDAGSASAPSSATPTLPTTPPTSATPTLLASCRPGTTETRTITVDGRKRSFVISFPVTWRGRTRLPVVFLIHGLGGNGEQILSYTGMGDQGKRDGFITVAPNGDGRIPRWDFRTPPSVAGSDASFIQQLTRAVTADYCGDPARQYLAGFSNGSAIAFAFACMNSFEFKAYGAVAGAGFQSSCDRARPASFIYFHGTADRVVPYEGGQTPLGHVQPAATSLAEWAHHDGCATRPNEEQVASGILRRSWSGCDAGSRVIAYTISGAGHTWPGAYPAGALGTTTEAISATKLIAQFFGLAAHDGN